MLNRGKKSWFFVVNNDYKMRIYHYKNGGVFIFQGVKILLVQQ